CHTSYYWLPAVLKKFSQLFPAIKIKIVTGATDHPLPSLLSGEIDMMISYTHKPDPNVVQQELFRDEMLAIIPAEHSWACKDHINAHDFADETLITHAGSLETSNIYEELLKKLHIKPADTIFIPFTDACIELVKAGLGIMVLPKWMLKPYLNTEGLEFKPITSKGVYRHQYISILKEKDRPVYYDYFITYLKEEISNSPVD
ncbi:MAG TPA: LysR family transcriptional regulator substrate-binding protein, partial [Pedobacter sp.]